MKTLIIGAGITILGVIVFSFIVAGSPSARRAAGPAQRCGKYQMEPGPGGWLVMPHGDGSAGVEKARFASACRRNGLQPIQVTDERSLLVCKEGNTGFNFLFTHNALLGTTVQGMVVEKGVDVTCAQSARLYEVAESVRFNYAK